MNYEIFSYLFWHHSKDLRNDINRYITEETNLSILSESHFLIPFNKFKDFAHLIYAKEHHFQHINDKANIQINNFTKDKHDSDHMHLASIKLLNYKKQECIVSSEYNSKFNLRDAIKWELRKRFNPKHKIGSFHFSPLPIGVSHDHIVHCADTKAEMCYIDFLLESTATSKKICRKLLAIA